MNAFKKLVCMALLGSICLTSCAPQERSTVVDVEMLARHIEATFETPGSDTDNIIRDRRVRVNAPALDGVWFYTQLNTGAEGKLYRQRLSHLSLSDDGTKIIQRTYGLKDPPKYENAWGAPGLLEAVTKDDFEPYFNEGCELTWTPQEDGWSGYVDPKTCIVTSKRRNKDIRIESEAFISRDIFRTNERGFDMDMTFLWGTKPGEMITLYPVR